MNHYIPFKPESYNMINPKLYLPFILLFIFHLFSLVLTRKISEVSYYLIYHQSGFIIYPMGLEPIPVPPPGSPPPPPPPPDWPPRRPRPRPPPRPNLLPYHTDLLGYHSNAFQGIKKNPMYTSHLVGYYPYYDYQPYIPFLVPSTTSNHYTHTSTPPALISMQDTIGVEYFDKDVRNNFKHPTLLKDLERGQRHDPAYVDPSSRGIYLREASAFQQSTEWTVEVDPKFHEDANKIGELAVFEEHIELHSTDSSVVKAPDYLLLTKNGRTFNNIWIDSEYAPYGTSSVYWVHKIRPCACSEGSEIS
ncbi:uncharacterized protein LOC130948153 isoform X2 [Arachis stenosperma]|uniref:uncharacterized protein LOC130948153 isoform X2 n=1 Tax=Arachis stenosperma TaxID=217475 RepID=UPI0025AD83E5|nr:uncharacterized protein LOC130948153 isoform X2 [Arachis stenosperma]